MALWIHQPGDPAASRARPIRIVRPPREPGRATLLFAGDTGAVDAALPVIAERGPRYPFGSTVDLVGGADLAVLNVETPVTDGGRRFPVWKEYSYRAPASWAGALAWAGFDVALLANNHAGDYGAEGIADTLANLGASGLATVGAGQDGAAARRGLIARIGEVRVGILAYCERQLWWELYLRQYASPDHPGVAALTERSLRQDVARLRGEVDVLVVSLHLGDTYAPPSSSTIAWSRRAIDLGADLVVNHHPHLAHPLMLHRGRPIVLSLGNYAWGPRGRPSLEHGWLLFARIEGRRLERLEVVPIAVQNRRVRFRPEPLYGAELAAVLGRLRAESAAYGAELRIEQGRGVLALGQGGGA